MAFDRGIGSAGTGTSRGVVDRVATVETISDLKSYTGPEDSVIVQGYYTAGDGGGGEFYWDSTSTTTANDGTIIQATGVSTGRWIRIYGSSISVKWFGAKGDGSTDDTSDIQSAINSLENIIYFPSGTYNVTGLTSENSQSWIGDGIDITTIRFPQSDQTDKNLISKASAWSNFKCQDMTLKGSLDSQATAFGGGYGYAVYIRQAINNVSFERVKVTKFGDQSNTNGGGIILGYPTTTPTTGYASSNISVIDCIFDNNANVPGFYFSQGGDGNCKTIKLRGNKFTGAYTGSGAQNCIYILGADSTHYINDVDISNNSFQIANNIDQCVELNWVTGFNVSDNPCVIESGVTTSNGHVLLRDGCYSGTIGNNPCIDYSGNSVNAVALVRFASPGTGTIENISIESNSVDGFDDGILIGEGSLNISLSNNSIKDCSGAAYQIASCADVTIQGGNVYNCAYVATLGTGGGASTMRRVTMSGIDSYSCNTGIITTTVVGEDIEGFVMKGCSDVGSSGTNMVDFNVLASTGNRFENNLSNLIPINPSHLTNFEYIKLAEKSVISIADADATPNIREANHYKTANTGATTITDFDGGHEGQEIFVELDSNTTIDFTGTNLKGNGGADLTGTATNAIRCKRKSTTWMCEVIGA